VPTSPIVDLPAEGAQYGAVLAPTGDGGALLVWLEDHFMETPEWRLRALALGPDGAPRAEPTLLVSGTHAELGHVVVEPSGERAVLVYDDDTAVRALPLACAD
jgi:hypothetical protein